MVRYDHYLYAMVPAARGEAGCDASCTAALLARQAPPEAARARPDDPRAAAYLRTLQRWGAHKMRLETTVGDLLVMTATLQLALRHPAVGGRVRRTGEAFLAGAIAAVEALDPLLGTIARLGNDPAQDVPAGTTRPDAPPAALCQDPPALQIWPFAQAPAAYQALSTHGGDEEWVLFCPEALVDAGWHCELLEALQLAPGAPCGRYVGTWGWAETHAVAGGRVVICAQT